MSDLLSILLSKFFTHDVIYKIVKFYIFADHAIPYYNIYIYQKYYIV